MNRLKSLSRINLSPPLAMNEPAHSTVLDPIHQLHISSCTISVEALRVVRGGKEHTSAPDCKVRCDFVYQPDIQMILSLKLIKYLF
jgi:hypothetical protein